MYITGIYIIYVYTYVYIYIIYIPSISQFRLVSKVTSLDIAIDFAARFASSGPREKLNCSHFCSENCGRICEANQMAVLTICSLRMAEGHPDKTWQTYISIFYWGYLDPLTLNTRLKWFFVGFQHYEQENNDAQKVPSTLPESRQVHPTALVGNFSLYKEIEYQTLGIILPLMLLLISQVARDVTLRDKEVTWPMLSPCGYCANKLHIHSSNSAHESAVLAAHSLNNQHVRKRWVYILRWSYTSRRVWNCAWSSSLYHQKLTTLSGFLALETLDFGVRILIIFLVNLHAATASVQFSLPYFSFSVQGCQAVFCRKTCSVFLLTSHPHPTPSLA